MRHLLFIPALLAVWTPLAEAGPPAKEAIRALARERGGDLLNRVVQVTGQRGAHQPGVWRIVVREQKGLLREYYLTNGLIASEGIVPPQAAQGLNGNAVPLARVTADSSTAFAKAEATARGARIAFSSVNYQLRCLELSENPAWFLQLLDINGNKVGTVSVSAASGEVISRQWFVKAAPPATPPPAQYVRQRPPAPVQPIASRSLPRMVVPPRIVPPRQS